MKYIRYRRKSSEQEERQALSTESQKRGLEEKFPDLQVVTDFEESKSAFYPNTRPRFSEMLKMIKKGKANGIIAWHPDRLSRNEIDAAKITYLARTGVIKDLKFGSYYFDKSPEGIMMLQIALSQSQYFSSKLGKDVKRGLKTKAENGWYPAMAPAGYKHDPLAQKGNKKILKDPRRFNLVSKAIRLVIEGEPPKEVLHLLNDEWSFRTRKMGKLGGKPLSRSGWYNLLSSPFYYGEYEYPKGSGNWHQGKHQRMITREEYDLLQQRLGRYGNRRPHTRKFAFTGLIKCGECGGMITAEEKWQTICTKCKTKFTSTHRGGCPNCGLDIAEMDNPTISHYIYYRCSKQRKGIKCSQRYLRVKNLEGQVDEFLSGVQISERFKNWAMKHLSKQHRNEVDDRTTINQSLQAAYNEVQKKLDDLLDLKLAEGVTGEEYRKKRQELLKEKKDLKEKLGDTDARADKWLVCAEETFDFAHRARFRFAKGTKETKRTILSNIGLNLVLKDRRLSIEASRPINAIEDIKKHVPEVDIGFEPEKHGLTKAQLEDLFASNPLLLPRLDSNQ